MKIISFFNHKGGVSKTTTAFNVGAKLAQLGKKILLVDADSQCNLTGLVAGFQQGKNVEENKISNYYKENDTIYSVIIDFLQGKAIEVESRAKESRLYKYTANEANNNLFLLGGDIQFAEIESRIETAKLLSGNRLAVTSTQLKTPGVFRKVFSVLSELHSFDYVIVDMSPSIGILNQCLLMNSDYFIIPTTPDFFSNQALHSISKVLPISYDDFSIFRSNNDLNGYKLPNQPQFLGYVIQNFKLTSGKKGSSQYIDGIKPAGNFQRWITKIEETIRTNTVMKFKTANMLRDRDFEGLCKAYIPDFNSLNPKSQIKNKPVFMMNTDELKSTQQSEQQKQMKIKQFDDIFDKLCKDIITKSC